MGINGRKGKKTEQGRQEGEQQSMERWKSITASVILSAVLAAELALLADVAVVLYGKALSIPKFAAVYAVLFLLTWLPALRGKRKAVLAAGIGAVVAIPTLVTLLLWYSVSRSVGFAPVDDSKAKLYGGQRVMLLVPHQDDEYNVLGGVMEEYVKYGSEVFVVYSTNGDYYGLVEDRYWEAIHALGRVGIPEDHILFLGYGDEWNPEGPHIYNAEPGQVVTSFIGRQETYGTRFHAVYREGRPYTVDNYLSDIEAVILEYRPDVIFCVDQDDNTDHQALSMGFEKVLGKILKEYTDYRPLVLKGFAYSSAWRAERDFYAENLLATQNVFESPDPVLHRIYRWEERTRLPVHGESLSRSLLGTEAHKVISTHYSQETAVRSIRILNGDKVFWLRRTDSLCHEARVDASSSDPKLLNDFMLLENRNLKENRDHPYDGVWIPAASDGEKQVQVTFSQPWDIKTIVLYDHPDIAHNVLNARIAFDDGTALETGPLDPGGAASEFVVEKTAVTSFTVTLLETEGEAGLTEVEAFDGETVSLPNFGKVMDAEGNYVYDYWIDPSGQQGFLLYSNGWDTAGLTCVVDNPNCGAAFEEGKIRVTCPEGERCILSVRNEDGEAVDRVMIRNPGAMERSWKQFWLKAEEKWTDLSEKKLFSYRLILLRVVIKLTHRIA